MAGIINNLRLKDTIGSFKGESSLLGVMFLNGVDVVLTLLSDKIGKK